MKKMVYGLAVTEAVATILLVYLLFTQERIKFWHIIVLIALNLITFVCGQQYQRYNHYRRKYIKLDFRRKEVE